MHGVGSTSDDLTDGAGSECALRSGGSIHRSRHTDSYFTDRQTHREQETEDRWSCISGRVPGSASRLGGRTSFHASHDLNSLLLLLCDVRHSGICLHHKLDAWTTRSWVGDDEPLAMETSAWKRVPLFGRLDGGVM